MLTACTRPSRCFRAAIAWRLMHPSSGNSSGAGRVRAGETARTDAFLELGTVAEQLEVNGAAPIIAIDTTADAAHIAPRGWSYYAFDDFAGRRGGFRKGSMIQHPNEPKSFWSPS